MRIHVAISILFLLILGGCNQFELAEMPSSDLSSYSLKNCQYVRNYQGQIVSWKNAIPVVFYLSQNIPEQWREIMKDAAKVWTTPLGSELIRIKSDLSAAEVASYDKKNIVYWIDSGTLFNYQQGQTITRWTRNQIEDSDILINSKDFRFYADIPEDRTRIHLKSLMVHEFGHALGLKHVPEVISVMYPELAFVQIRIDLSEIDQTSMKCEYPQ